MNYEELGGAYATSYVSNGLIPLDQVMMDLTTEANDISNNNGSGNMDDSDDEVSQNTNRTNVPNGAEDENGS